MRNNSFVSLTIVVLFLLIVFFSKNSYAYLDPGTGSYIFQLLIAGIIGGIFSLKIFWTKIKSFFKNLFSKE